jgi:hypothetical protein
MLNFVFVFRENTSHLSYLHPFEVGLDQCQWWKHIVFLSSWLDNFLHSVHICHI